MSENIGLPTQESNENYKKAGHSVDDEKRKKFVVSVLDISVWGDEFCFKSWLSFRVYLPAQNKQAGRIRQGDSWMAGCLRMKDTTVSTSESEFGQRRKTKEQEGMIYLVKKIKIAADLI